MNETKKETVLTLKKIALISLISLLLIIPLTMISGVIDEREYSRREVKTEIQDTIFIASFCDEYYKTPSTEDVLNEREELRYSLWVDSIYLAMPKDILIRIPTNKGTQESVIEIVEEYIKNKDKYHGNK